MGTSGRRFESCCPDHLNTLILLTKSQLLDSKPGDRNRNEKVRKGQVRHKKPHNPDTNPDSPPGYRRGSDERRPGSSPGRPDQQIRSARRLEPAALYQAAVAPGFGNGGIDLERLQQRPHLLAQDLHFFADRRRSRARLPRRCWRIDRRSFRGLQGAPASPDCPGRHRPLFYRHPPLKASHVDRHDLRRNRSPRARLGGRVRSPASRSPKASPSRSTPGRRSSSRSGRRRWSAAFRPRRRRARSPASGCRCNLLGDAVAEKSGVLFPGMDWELDEAETCALFSATPVTTDEKLVGRIVAFAEASRRLVVPDDSLEDRTRFRAVLIELAKQSPDRPDRDRRQSAPEEERPPGGRCRPRLVQDRVSAQRRGDPPGVERRGPT